jgi:hypothetical protein
MQAARAGVEVRQEFSVFNGFVVVSVDQACTEGRGVVAAVGPVSPLYAYGAGVATGGDQTLATGAEQAF